MGKLNDSSPLAWPQEKEGGAGRETANQACNKEENMSERCKVVSFNFLHCQKTFSFLLHYKSPNPGGWGVCLCSTCVCMYKG